MRICIWLSKLVLSNEADTEAKCVLSLIQSQQSSAYADVPPTPITVCIRNGDEICILPMGLPAISLENIKIQFDPNIRKTHLYFASKHVSFSITRWPRKHTKNKNKKKKERKKKRILSVKMAMSIAAAEAVT